MYADDYDDVMATDFEETVGPTGAYYYWFWDIEQITNYSTNTTTINYQGGLLYPYTKNYSFLFCPSDPLALDPGPNYGYDLPSYAINENVKDGCDYTLTGYTTACTESGTNYSQIQEPASTILSGDAEQLNITFSSAPDTLYRNDYIIAFSQDYPSQVNDFFGFTYRFQGDHAGPGTNVAWLDGHSKHMHVDTGGANACPSWLAGYGESCAQLAATELAGNEGDVLYAPRGTQNDQYYYDMNKPNGL
jgi:prepilin-type processing-associated H-X9-DG protein